MGWFDVDKAGLAAILERRGKAFAIFELVQNAFDSGTERVKIGLEPIPGQPYATLTVEDWGDGFADLAHANTMFARSNRAGDATKRGRFNLGEKLVLAVCRKASIQTTTGTVEFRDDGTVKRHTLPREQGTLFTAEIKMTRDEYTEVCEAVAQLIPPVATTFNGKSLDRPDSIVQFETKLPTEIADADGQLRRTTRIATVEVYEGEPNHGMLLEMGIPIVETENGYRVNVLQKIPLNMDRDNVTPGFLRTVNAELLNQVHGRLTEEEAATPWAQEAAGDARATPETVKGIVVKRFGEHAVIANPFDPTANAVAASHGFTVVPGGSLSSDAWSNIRKHNVLLPSSKVFPTPRPEAIAEQREGKCPTCGR